MKPLAHPRIPRLKIGILYADMISGAAANRILQQLQTRFRPSGPIAYCSFRQLQRPGDPALHWDAADVDLLFFASVDGWLPVEVRQWLSGWMDLPRNRRVAVAALIYSPGEQPHSSCRWLRRMGRARGIDVIDCGRADAPEGRAARKGYGGFLWSSPGASDCRREPPCNLDQLIAYENHSD